MNLLHDVTTFLAGLAEDPQGQRLLTLSFPRNDGPDSVLLANAINANEALSRDFEFQVEVLSDNALIPLKDMMGKLVTIALVRNDGTLRYFNGYVFDFSLVRTDAGFAFYRMTLKPWLAFLRLRQNSRVFQNLNICELCEQTFDDYQQRDYRYAITGKTPNTTLMVQYNESDYNHLHRRLEQAGLYYWYEHSAEGHTLWIGDDSTLGKSIEGEGTMRFQNAAGAMEDDGIHQWSPVRHVSSGKVAVNSYNFKNARSNRMDRPSLNPQGKVAPLEVYEDTGAYGFKDDEAGEALATRRMEEIDARGQDFSAEGNDRAAQPGRSFRLTEHFSGGARGRDDDDAPLEDRAGREYLIVSVHHQASNNYQDGRHALSHYGNTLTCLRKSKRWRPHVGLNSRDVRIYGVQTATVVGHKGSEILTDEFGRVRLQFHWDRDHKFDAASSPWVRVMTSMAGNRFGMIGIPRVGQEVVVTFLDGVCDRPLVIGCVYNAANMPPWELPANKTQSGILTRSTREGSRDNANALRFEDLKGKEEVWLHAERDQRIEVEHDESHSVGNDRSKTVGRDETVQVKHDRTETVGNDEKITVHGKRTERVDGEEKIDIGGTRVETVGQNDIVTIAGTRIETVMLAKNEMVMLEKALEVGDNYGVLVGGSMATTVARSQVELVGQSKDTRAGTTYTITAKDSFEITVGSASLKMTSDGAITISGTRINIGASGPVHINGKDVDVN
ncbi:type VI secretion system Vgr family protein [Rugamonas fusca]|uniref:type VI secretion system Vgr family protein n=1 Tax=Rugamonas fusca TaxID=2758568 RepID=UPI001E2FA9D9|nr:type VI secretion system tip protein TssI/VgrG [Rugamonas fusca]